MKKVLFGLLALVFVLACSKTAVDKESVSREEVFEHIYQNAMLKVHQDFVESTSDLTEKTQNFKAENTLENFKALRNQWINTKLAWAQVELYNIGNINLAFMHNRLNKFPTNTALIESNLLSTEAISTDFIAQSGSNVVGLPAIEYLLFGKGENEDMAFAWIENSNLKSQYLNYLLALSEDLAAESERLLIEIQDFESPWLGNTDNYSLNQLVNAQVALLETITRNKIGKPSGLYGSAGEDPEKVECVFSLVSFEVIRANLESIAQSFEANGASPNFYTLMDEVNGSNALSNSIKQSLEECFTLIKGFEKPLKEEVLLHPEKINELNIALKNLLLAVKVDLANSLGVTVVFNDNDGD